MATSLTALLRVLVRLIVIVVCCGRLTGVSVAIVLWGGYVVSVRAVLV